ncbi:hypothetical protein [Chryseobacterium wanjuense]
MLETKIFFIDVFYNLTSGTTTFNGTTIINDLNQKGFNQVSLNVSSSSGANKTLFIKPTDQEMVNGVYDGTPISNFIQSKGTSKPYELTDLNKGLRVITSKFYENIINEIIANIETELKKLEVNDGTSTRKLLDASASIKSELTSLNDPRKTYSIIIDALYSYLRYEFNINYIFAFICHNVETIVNSTTSGTTVTTTRDEAMAFLDAKELIIPNNAIGKTITLAHEIAHSFGLRHTFDLADSPPQLGDLRLAQQQTLENIMDYPKNGDLDRRDFITYQWEKIRTKTTISANSIADLDIKINNTSNGLKDFKNSQNLLRFSSSLFDWLSRALEKNIMVISVKLKILVVKF